MSIALDPLPPLRVAIAMPCYDSIARETTISLAMLMLRVGLEPPQGLAWIGIDWRSTSNLPESRAVLAERAVSKHEATHVLWIDADMAFPADALHRLLAHDLDMVGANYPRRAPPHWSACMDAERIPFQPGMKGVTESAVMGFGLFLMRTSVLDGLPKPWFAHHDEHGYVTEDAVFCRAVRAKGHSLWCDHDLSREVRHVGSVAFSAADIVAYDVKRGAAA